MQHRLAPGSSAAPLAAPLRAGAAKVPGPARAGSPELNKRWTQRRLTLRSSSTLVAALIIAFIVCSQIYQHRRLYHLALDGHDAACRARLTAAGLRLGSEDVSLDVQLHTSRYTLVRTHTYSAMAAELATKGMSLGGTITQGLTQADLFGIQPVSVQPQDSAELRTGDKPRRVLVKAILRPLEVPVRAVVLPLLDPEVASQVHDAVARALKQAAMDGNAVWWQGRQLYHATVYHASTHTHPVAATSAEIEGEAAAIGAVASGTCPIQAILERIVITSSGVIVACWQVLPSGGEPAELRHALQAALPRSPPHEHQAVREPAMLHTTVARLLLAPAVGDNAQKQRQPAAASARHGSSRGEVADGVEWSAVASAVTEDICGLRAIFDELWFVEEQDLLALALQGRYVCHLAVPLRCGAAVRP